MRAGLVGRGRPGGRAPNKDEYRPALTHPSWVNINAGWYERFFFEKKNQKTFIRLS